MKRSMSLHTTTKHKTNFNKKMKQIAAYIINLQQRTTKQNQEENYRNTDKTIRKNTYSTTKNTIRELILAAKAVTVEKDGMKEKG